MGEMNTQVCAIKLEKQHGLIVLVVALLASGWATVIAGFLSKNEADKKPAIIIGIVQIIATSILIGWLWAIWTSYKIYQNSQ